jgi:phosphoribosylamine---glycine ligase
MRLLLIDPLGVGLDVSWRATREGHHVKHFIPPGKEKCEHIGRGLVDRVDDFHPWLNWADLVLNCDNTRYLRELDALAASGQAVVSASQESSQWELDRTLGQSVLKKHGVAVLPVREFTDYDQAIAHVKKHDIRFVSKPSGDDPDKALSYVSKSPADMVYMLERWKKLAKMKTPFILQEFVPGIEMAVGGWFGPGGFNQGWLENYEFKKLMNDDLGVSTGEQGTIIRYVRSSKLARKMLAPLADELAKLKYVGYIDVNCIIDDRGTAWPLEFTMRPGWPTFNIQRELHSGDSVEWLLDLALGIDAKNVVMDKVACGVVMSIPDYPYSHLTRKEVLGVPVYGLTEGLLKHWHPCEMMMSKEPVPHVVAGQHVKVPMMVAAGDYLGVMSGTASTVKDAALTVYRRLRRLIVPNSPMYRTDIGKRLAKQLPILQKHGYATAMVYSEPSSKPLSSDRSIAA